MPEQATRIRIFISSPGDVKAERDALKHLIEHDLQRTLGDDRGLYLEPVMWETHTIPGLGDIQDNIFDQVGGFDIFIGFFWQHFGTPTGDYDSGSEAEFYKAYEMWQQNSRLPVLMYFCNKPMNVSAENIEQITKVVQFKTQIADKGLYCEYGGVSELKDLARIHLHKAILGLLGEEPAADATQPLDAAYRAYLNRLRRQCQLLPLGAFGFEHGAEDEITLDQVYINLLTTTHRKAGDTDKDDKEIPVSALEAVEQTNRLVLLGDPGSGKSTFVNQLLADFAEARLHGLPLPAGLPPDLVPVRMVLRRFANRLIDLDLNGLSAEECDSRLAALFIEQAFEDVQEELKQHGAIDRVRQAFDTGQVFLVLDGLDEIPSRSRLLMKKAVQALLKTYTMGCTIITCRVRSYQEEAQHIAGFDSFTLAPFDDDQIQTFVSGWYNTPHSKEHFGEEKANEKAASLRTAVLGPALKGLARNPMLLTTMAVIHQRDIGLPDQRARLYELAVDVLLRRWLTHRGSDVNASEELNAFLADERRLLPAMYALAYQAHSSGTEEQEKTDIGRGDALILLEKKAYLGSPALAGAFLDYVDQRSGILVGQGGSDGEAPLSYSFPHRTFQEYLAGCYIVSQPDVAEALIDHATRDDYWYIPVQMGLEEMLHNRKQEWPLLRLAYQLCPPAFPENNATQQRLVLWAGVMAQLVTKTFILEDGKTPGGGEGFYDRLQNHLVLLLSGRLPPIERVEAGRILGHLGDPRRGLLEIEAMPMCFVPAGPFLMGDGAKETDVPYAYWIGEYPVTQAHYRAFVEAGGYNEEQWWTKAGRDRKKQGEWTNPRERGHPFDLPNHPVVGVSWYEALAFTRWLTAQGHRAGWLGRDREIRLANDAEWEKAARGGLMIPESPVIQSISLLRDPQEIGMKGNPQPDRRYPWGDEIDANKCNYRNNIRTTSTPGCFAQGESPYGLQDASGNVREWCRKSSDGDEAEEGTGRRVLRGGSFGSSGGSVRCAVRVWYVPYLRNYYGGFRIVVLPFTGGE